MSHTFCRASQGKMCYKPPTGPTPHFLLWKVMGLNEYTSKEFSRLTYIFYDLNVSTVSVSKKFLLSGAAKEVANGTQTFYSPTASAHLRSCLSRCSLNPGQARRELGSRWEDGRRCKEPQELQVFFIRSSKAAAAADMLHSLLVDPADAAARTCQAVLIQVTHMRSAINDLSCYKIIIHKTQGKSKKPLG